MTDAPSQPADPALPAVGIDRGRIDDAVYQAFNPGPIPWKRGDDGLPAPDVATRLPLVAPLSVKTMVCLADRSSFVRRDPRWGDVLATYAPEEVQRSDGGRYYVEIDKEQGLTLLDRLRRIFGWRLLERVEVEPIRPQCNFLARQMTDMQDEPTHQLIERLCTARRDEQSFFLSVANAQLHACELRTPRDPVSEVRLDRFDAAKIKLGAARLEGDEGKEFDVDAALDRTEAEASRGLGYGGIFKE